MKTSLRFTLPVLFALTAAGCVQTRTRSKPQPDAPAGPTHEVILTIDGKVVGHWTTTGKIEVNGNTINATEAPPAPPLMERP